MTNSALTRARKIKNRILVWSNHRYYILVQSIRFNVHLNGHDDAKARSNIRCPFLTTLAFHNNLICWKNRLTFLTMREK